MTERPIPLPPGAMPRGLSQVQAAFYIGASALLFDAMVNDKRMPKPKRINKRLFWERWSIDAAFTDIDGGKPADDVYDPWSDFAV